MVGLVLNVSEVSNAIYIKLFNEYCESVFAACDTIVSAKCLVKSIDGAMQGLAIPVLEKATLELQSLRQMASQRTFCVNRKQAPRLGFLKDLESLLQTLTSLTAKADTALVNCTSELVRICCKVALQSQLVYSFCVNSLKDPLLSHIDVLFSALICSIIEDAPATRLQEECRMLVERLSFVDCKRVAGSSLPQEVMALLNADHSQLANSPNLREVAESICRAREIFRKSVFQQLPYETRFEFDSLSKTVLPDQNITLAIASTRRCDTVA